MKTTITAILLLLSTTSFATAYVFNESVHNTISLIDTDTWLHDVEKLSSYNRHYKHSGIMQARDWLVTQFNALKIPTHLEEISINGIKGHNIVAEIKGTERADEIYIIGAHYDATSEQPNIAAPGAEDNASGTAALLALARAIKAYQPPKATIRFIAFSGEEAGLFGSIAYVKKLEELNQQSLVHGVLIMDMIAFSEDDDLDIIVETSAANNNLVELVEAAAKDLSQARAEHTFNYWGSDHVPFIDANYPTALVIEGDYEQYPHYHKSTDTPPYLSKAMAHEILKTVGGTLSYWVY